MSAAPDETPFRIDGLVALVTGSNGGIGAAVALALARAGADVVCHGREDDAPATRAAIAALGRRALGVRADLARRADQEHLIHAALAEAGRIDILVNNAGIIRRAPAAQHTDADWDAVLEVDLTAVFRLCRLAGALMLARGCGRIVNVASLLSFQGGITVPGYAAAKGGVAQLTKALANEWAGRGVNVNAIAPGYIATRNTEALRRDESRQRQILERIPAGRWGTPDDIAGAAVFLSAPASAYVHGHVLTVDGGWMGR